MNYNDHSVYGPFNQFYMPEHFRAYSAIFRISMHLRSSCDLPTTFLN